MIEARIRKLRDQFQKLKIDGYVIPKNDEFFSEYSKKDRLKSISKTINYLNKQKKEMRRARFLEEKKLKEQKEKEEKKKQEEIKQRNKKYRPKQSDESKKNFNLEREKHSRELLEQKIAQSESELSKNIITKHPYLSGLALLIFLFYVLPKILP